MDEKLKIILFFNTCATAEYYYHIFKLTELANCIILDLFCKKNKRNKYLMYAWEIEIKKRNIVYNLFKLYDNKKTSVLITTNVVARGIDFNDV